MIKVRIRIKPSTLGLNEKANRNYRWHNCPFLGLRLRSPRKADLWHQSCNSGLMTQELEKWKKHEAKNRQMPEWLKNEETGSWARVIPRIRSLNPEVSGSSGHTVQLLPALMNPGEAQHDSLGSQKVNTLDFTKFFNLRISKHFASN